MIRLKSIEDLELDREAMDHWEVVCKLVISWDDFTKFTIFKKRLNASIKSIGPKPTSN